MSKCKTVTLRKRKIKNGTQYSLCLDYYPGYRDNTTMKVITREALGIYIFAKPANQQERDFNARMMKKAEILRNRRYEAIFNENNGFFDKAKMKGDFLAYFKELADRRNIKWQPSTSTSSGSWAANAPLRKWTWTCAASSWSTC